jgi:hypothetical protein
MSTVGEKGIRRSDGKGLVAEGWKEPNFYPGRASNRCATVTSVGEALSHPAAGKRYVFLTSVMHREIDSPVLCFCPEVSLG